MSILGTRLRELRNEFGLTQAELSQEIGIGQSTLSDLERGSPPKMIGVLTQLASFYRCSVDYLVGLSEDRVVYRNNLPTHGVEIMSMVIELSELRRLELLYLAKALYELEQTEQFEPVDAAE
ncbi:MAG: hypothetical protein DCC55_25750 [Chloroflexi bacterium]|nr:MAG: hypothetical protein DCC55_25750 [Chloroflexota bacterium]